MTARQVYSEAKSAELLLEQLGDKLRVRAGSTRSSNLGTADLDGRDTWGGSSESGLELSNLSLGHASTDDDGLGDLASAGVLASVGTKVGAGGDAGVAASEGGELGLGRGKVKGGVDDWKHMWSESREPRDGRAARKGESEAYSRIRAGA